MLMYLVVRITEETHSLLNVKGTASDSAGWPGVLSQSVLTALVQEQWV